MMVNYYRVSTLAANISQDAAMAHAFRLSGATQDWPMAGSHVAERFERLAEALGYKIEKITTPELRVA